MDPVSVFKALYDTKCLKFGQYELKSGLQAPYYINLRRLPLYPKLMDAVVTQVVDRYLTDQALIGTLAQVVGSRKGELQRHSAGENTSPLDEGEVKCPSSASEGARENGQKLPTPVDSDADSQLEEDEDSDNEKLTGNLDPILCGVPYGAVPLAAAIAYKAKLPYLFERKDTKAHGDQQCLLKDFTPETRSSIPMIAPQDSNTDKVNPKATEASAKHRQSVILIEDVICSGESILDAVKALEKRDLKVEFVICIVDREENGVNLLLEQEGIRVFSLYNISAIFRVLEATGRISNGQFVRVRQWMSRNQFEAIGIDPSEKCSLTTKSPSAEITPTKSTITVSAI